MQLNEALSPRELKWARDVIAAENDPAAHGLYAFSLNGKMDNPPVFRRAHDTLAVAGSN